MATTSTPGSPAVGGGGGGGGGPAAAMEAAAGPGQPHRYHPQQPYHHQYQQQQYYQHQGGGDTRFVPVSVSKTARAYFNIARKALETHRRVELSALEAAVVIAVDASFLLTRAKMGTVERVNTAFVQVPSHQHGYGHLRKARIQIVIHKTRELGDSTATLIAFWLMYRLLLFLVLPSFVSLS
jgi:hypothetical protein